MYCVISGCLQALGLAFLGEPTAPRPASASEDLGG